MRRGAVEDPTETRAKAASSSNWPATSAHSPSARGITPCVVFHATGASFLFFCPLQVLASNCLPTVDSGRGSEKLVLTKASWREHSNMSRVEFGALAYISHSGTLSWLCLPETGAWSRDNLEAASENDTFPQRLARLLAPALLLMILHTLRADRSNL